MEEKIKIIKQIVKHHPGYGTEKGYSWYEGGMRDTGDWKWEKMIDEPIDKLRSFLSDLSGIQKRNNELNRLHMEEYNRVQAMSEIDRTKYYIEKGREMKEEWNRYAKDIESRLMWDKNYKK